MKKFALLIAVILFACAVAPRDSQSASKIELNQIRTDSMTKTPASTTQNCAWFVEATTW